jgi:hypothetical protein
MRLRVMILPLLVLLTLTAAAAHRGRTPRAPQEAKVTGACNASDQARINPPSIAMRRSDNVVWTSSSPQATSWTVTPKDTLDWPWTQRSFTGTPATPATTPQPLPSAIEKHPYRYNVLVRCADGSTQNIDPDIIIGGEQ